MSASSMSKTVTSCVATYYSSLSKSVEKNLPLYMQAFK